MHLHESVLMQPYFYVILMRKCFSIVLLTRLKNIEIFGVSHFQNILFIFVNQQNKNKFISTYLQKKHLFLVKKNISLL